MQKERFVLGIHGDIGSGKSIVSKFLVNKLDFKCLSFADPVRRACFAIFNFTPDQMSDRNHKEIVDPRWGISPRNAMRLLATDLLREKVCEDIWIRNLHQRIETFCTQNSIVIDDVRYQNEVDFIENELKGTVIHIMRHKNPFEPHSSEHSSDCQQLAIKSGVVIYNDAGIDEIQVQLLFLLYNIGYFNKHIFEKMVEILNRTTDVCKRS